MLYVTKDLLWNDSQLETLLGAASDQPAGKK
jgi:hypothetical protein